jgi:hypothetical protein
MALAQQYGSDRLNKAAEAIAHGIESEMKKMFQEWN